MCSKESPRGVPLKMFSAVSKMLLLHNISGGLNAFSFSPFNAKQKIGLSCLNLKIVFRDLVLTFARGALLKLFSKTLLWYNTTGGLRAFSFSPFYSEKVGLN